MKSIEPLVQVLWRAAETGLKPLCLLRARNEACSYPGIFSITLRFYYVASSPGSPFPHLLDGHRKLVGSCAIPARSCPGPFRYHCVPLGLQNREVKSIKRTSYLEDVSKFCCLVICSTTMTHDHQLRFKMSTTGARVPGLSQITS